ncbi:hypothetical protein H0H93_009492 [Arthromyces matolae]|nr:hypothetical protein H0H93_009492 [Arthromyces matolae]
MSDTLGKRKVREEEEDVSESTHGSTLFVSNLPYNATSVDLQTLFSDIAPVRSAFVVLEHGSGVSKGVGYVSFAIKEDAQMAYDTINQNGLSLVGRNLRVEWADKKPKDPGDKTQTREPKTKAPPRPQQPRIPQNPSAIRTVVISGLPSSIDSKVLWKKVRKYQGAEKVESMSADNTTGNFVASKIFQNTESLLSANVLFTTPAAATEAVNKLHAHVFKGHLLSVTLKKRLDTLSKTSAKNTSKSDGQSFRGPAPNPSSRLIVRNLPFNASEQDLRAAFLPYGPIYSIHIPTAQKQDEETEGSNTTKPVRTKGFAFVWMLSKKDAETAIEGCNGLTIRAGSAEILVTDKQKRKKQRREEKKAKLTTNTGNKSEDEDGDAAAEEIDDKRATERVIAVDWALSKDKWEEEKAKLEEGGDVEMEDASKHAESDEESSRSGEDSDESDDDDEGQLGVHTGGDDDSEVEEEDDENPDEPVKPTLPPPEAGTTLFVRNVPYTATEDELRTLFSSFGPLRYARITIDHETGRSRGTGFACFWNKADADKAIAQSDLLRSETTGGAAAPVKKNPFTLPSILTPDPSSSLAQSLVLHGRTLDVIRAVTRDEAGKLKEAGEKLRQKADKRNMYLLREGVILPNTAAAASLSPAEIERRTASFNSRRALLKSNPSLFISRTRLSIRQIPIFVSERMLKRLAIHAIRAFDVEAKKGDRLPLTEDELTEIPAPEDETEEQESKKSKKRFPGRQTGVKQAKIVRQTERVDPVTGKGRSKGYGFLELSTHADALRVLRWANNNPDIGPLFEEWWKEELKDLIKQEKSKDQSDDARVTRMKEELANGGAKKTKGTLICEFSIENIQVVQRRKTLQEQGQSGESKVKKESKTYKEDRSSKKQRVDMEEDEPAAVNSSPNSQKPKNNLGSLIDYIAGPQIIDVDYNFELPRPIWHTAIKQDTHPTCITTLLTQRLRTSDDATQLISDVKRRQNDVVEFQIPRLRSCNGPLSLQQNLATELREDIETLARKVEALELSVGDQRGEKSRAELRQIVEEFQSSLAHLRRDSRAALLTSKKAIDSQRKSQREELLASSVVSEKAEPNEKTTDDALMKANDNVTEALRRTLGVMQSELDRSFLSVQLLDASTTSLRATSSTHDVLTHLMGTSKQLITALEQSDWMDRILIISGFVFFLLVVLFILKQRFVDRGIRLAFWWTRFLPNLSSHGVSMDVEKAKAPSLSSALITPIVSSAMSLSATAIATSIPPYVVPSEQHVEVGSVETPNSIETSSIPSSVVPSPTLAGHSSDEFDHNVDEL